MGGWTAGGQTLDTKSSFCPGFVYILSRICPMAKKVQGLSSRCLTDVEILSKSMVFGQKLDKKIQLLSTECPMEQSRYWQTLMLDIFWTYFGLDGLWTKPVLDATLVGLPSPTHRSRTLTGQILDKDKFWTKPGFDGLTLAQAQTLDIVWTIMGYGQILG